MKAQVRLIRTRKDFSPARWTTLLHRVSRL